MDGYFRLKVIFYRTSSGKEPVRDWLKSLSKTEKKVIGENVKTIQFGWPLGMPLVRKLEPGLWEVRSQLDTRIARIIFTVDNDTMILLHGFIKKSQKIPKNDLELAKKRASDLKN